MPWDEELKQLKRQVIDAFGEDAAEPRSIGRSRSRACAAYAGVGITATKPARGRMAAAHVRDMLDHASVETTDRYLNAGRMGLHHSMQRFELPARCNPQEFKL